MPSSAVRTTAAYDHAAATSTRKPNSLVLYDLQVTAKSVFKSPSNQARGARMQEYNRQLPSSSGMC